MSIIAIIVNIIIITIIVVGRQVAQAVAKGLGIPVDMVKVRPVLSSVAPNASITAGSTTSERAVQVRWGRGGGGGGGHLCCVRVIC